MQLNKGASWVRYSVMHLERVLVRQFGAAALGELAPAPNQLIAALIEAAFPHAGWNVPPLGVRQVSEARAALGKSAPRASGAAASRKAAER
jgi:hypothetical protein